MDKQKKISELPKATTAAPSDFLLLETETGTKAIKKSDFLREVNEQIGAIDTLIGGGIE